MARAACKWQFFSTPTSCCVLRSRITPMRRYLGKDGEQIVILLCGGTKLRQQNDITLAKEYWENYKRQKRSGAWH